jgi:hypothetical protein
MEDITLSPPGNVTPSGSESSLASESADFSAQPPPTVEPSIPEGGRFDPEPQRERIRGYVALGLLGMLALVLVLAFISMWCRMELEVLRTVLTIIFGPLVTLVSAATGFYYGSRSSSP